MSNVFHTELVVRGYECGPDRTVPLHGVLSYCEHARWLWILRPELGLLDELAAGSFFVVHRATLALARTFGIGTAVTVRAALRSVGRVTCEVEQDLVRSDGALLARAHVTAVWLGPDGAMRRVPDATRRAVTDEPLVSHQGGPDRGGDGYLAPAERRFEPSLERLVQREVPRAAGAADYRVRVSDCDLHAHLNNAAYLRLFEDSCPTPAVRADIEYRGQAVPEETLTVRSWSAGAGSAFALQRADDVLCRAVLTPRP